MVANAATTTSINGTIGLASNAHSIGISIKNANVGTFTLGENTGDFAVYKSFTGEYISMSVTVQLISITEDSFVAHSITEPYRTYSCIGW